MKITACEVHVGRTIKRPKPLKGSDKFDETAGGTLDKDHSIELYRKMAMGKLNEKINEMLSPQRDHFTRFNEQF